MTLPKSADVVVIGAGLAGLAAATRLQRLGVEAVLLEAADGVGGRVRTDVVDGFRLDRGFQLLNPAYPEARRVLDLDALDLKPFLPGLVACTSESYHQLGDPRRLLRAVPGAVTAPVGSIREKLAFGAWAAGLGIGSPEVIAPSDDRPLSDELRRRNLDRLTATVLRPFLAGVLADEGLTTSTAMTSMLLRSFARGVPSVPAAGMQAMPDQLAARLDATSLHLGVRVETVSLGVVRTDAGQITARAVVVAGNGSVAGLDGVPGAPSRSLTTWWYAADTPPDDRALLRVDAEAPDKRGPLANTVVMTNAAPSYSSDGRALIQATAVGAHAGSEAAARRHAGLLYGVDPAGWELLRTDVIEHALPAHPAGQPLAQEVALGDGLFVCGDHRDTPSIQGALVSGRRAAEAVMTAIKQQAA